MDVTSISAISKTAGLAEPKSVVKVDQPGEGFGQVLGKALDELSKTQIESDDLMARLAAGEDIDIHDATLALESANVAFQLALQVRTKVVEAYQEVMRLQV